MKKEVPTRKKLAWKRLWLLVAVIVVMEALAGYNFAPRQAVSDVADELDMDYEKTFIKGFYDAGNPKHLLSLNYLVENQDAMLFCSVYWTPFGWQKGSRCKVEIWDDQSVYAGITGFYGDQERTYWLFGRMEEKPTAITLYYEEEVDLVTHHIGIEVPVEHLFQGDNGMWYLLSQVRTDWVEKESVEGYEGPREFGLFLSRDGERMADVEVKQ